uniref:Uncharacterized protein n=1 Tax=Tetraselmis chuii TaxID=63592 RepID=A0A7S1SK87_9CHLO|mmetsp:Transcript_16647/g.29706  ORF Transcript_16647/g.29706 Transcript_16647/m.29706 type:complete len:120 (+) Transcript_16647:246-605(+)
MATMALSTASAPAAVSARPSTSGRSSSLRVCGVGRGLSARGAAPLTTRRSAVVPVLALPEKEKTLTREAEPEEYWVSEAEKEGKISFEDPTAWIGITAIFFPFVFLLIAAAFGIVDLNP